MKNQRLDRPGRSRTRGLSPSPSSDDERIVDDIYERLTRDPNIDGIDERLRMQARQGAAIK